MLITFRSSELGVKLDEGKSQHGFQPRRNIKDWTRKKTQYWRQSLHWTSVIGPPSFATVFYGIARGGPCGSYDSPILPRKKTYQNGTKWVVFIHQHWWIRIHKCRYWVHEHRLLKEKQVHKWCYCRGVFASLYERLELVVGTGAG